jgi:hypothetical protein
MFKYTPKKQIVRSLNANRKKGDLAANIELAKTSLGKYPDKWLAYGAYMAFIQHYVNVEFYSPVELPFIAVNGVLFKASIFDVTSV